MRNGGKKSERKNERVSERQGDEQWKIASMRNRKHTNYTKGNNQLNKIKCENAHTMCMYIVHKHTHMSMYVCVYVFNGSSKMKSDLSHFICNVLSRSLDAPFHQFKYTKRTICHSLAVVYASVH